MFGMKEQRQQDLCSETRCLEKKRDALANLLQSARKQAFWISHRTSRRTQAWRPPIRMLSLKSAKQGWSSTDGRSVPRTIELSVCAPWIATTDNVWMLRGRFSSYFKNFGVSWGRKYPRFSSSVTVCIFPTGNVLRSEPVRGQHGEDLSCFSESYCIAGVVLQ